MRKNKHPHIVMTGGGTLGPVTPLLGIVEAWKSADDTAEFSWIGTLKGPEKLLVEEYGIPFLPLLAPKLERSRKWQWPFMPFVFFLSFVFAWRYVSRLRPDLVFSAGGYVSVPVALAAKLKGIPVWVHQLDYLPGWANRAMSPLATKITTTFPESASKFPPHKTSTIGAVVRARLEVPHREDVIKKYGLNPKLPTLLVTGGGTGALEINDALELIGTELVERMNIIHLTGPRKMKPKLQEIASNYYATELVTDEMDELYSIADLVIARGGLGTMMELAQHAKASIIIPIQNSHQELNAAVLAEHRAAKVIWEMNPQVLKQAIQKLMQDDVLRSELASNIHKVIPLNGADVIVEEAQELIGECRARSAEPRG